MATKRNQELSNENELHLIIDNGDLAALNSIKSKFNFRNEESILRFLITVMQIADTPKLTITRSGINTTITPSIDLLNSITEIDEDNNNDYTEAENQ